MGADAGDRIRRGEWLVALAVAAAILLPGLWSHSLIDPWEGHYAEVGRRVLEDHDWLRLSWQNEPFRSKPALAPWLIAASLRAHGLAADGGYSGEMVSSARVVWAVRLPFALFGVGGLFAVWLMLRRLVSRRAAWLGLGVLGASPFYALVARQAITDMPMVATTVGAIALFALAMGDGDARLRRWRGRFTGYHAVLLLIGVAVAVQIIYDATYLAHTPALGPGLRIRSPVTWMWVPFAVGYAALALITTVLWPVRDRRGAYIIGAYALLGVSILAKGPPGAVLAIGVCAGYIVATGQWRAVVRLRPIEGLIVLLLIAAPWHVAMALRDGQPWIDRYIGYHWLKRAGEGAHMVNAAGDGTVSYFVHELGVGLWPLVALIPASVLAAVRRRCETPADHVRLLALMWAVGGLAMFTAIETKYHHYVLPAVPGFAVLIALWLDDVAAGRSRAWTAAVVAGLVACALITWDVAVQQERIIEMFVYRYDRPWPAAAPWHVDLRAELIAWGAAFGLTALALFVRRWRRRVPYVVVGVALVFGAWVGNRYMGAAGPHWGQQQLHRAYYEQRGVHGAHVVYASAQDLRADWPAHGEHAIEVRTFVPRDVDASAPMTVTVHVGDQVARLAARVMRVTDAAITLSVSDGERARLAPLIATAAPSPAPRPPAIVVDADRLIAWNLFWRSELFWSTGELWGPIEDMRTTFRYGDDDGLRAYLTRPEAAGRRFFVLTEATQAGRLAPLLPTARARETLTTLDRSSNKFTLLSFTL